MQNNINKIYHTIIDNNLVAANRETPYQAELRDRLQPVYTKALDEPAENFISSEFEKMKSEINSSIMSSTALPLTQNVNNNSSKEPVVLLTEYDKERIKNIIDKQAAERKFEKSKDNSKEL